MFGKIKDKLKNIFNKTEEVIDEENPEELELIEEKTKEEPPKKETKKKEKKPVEEEKATSEDPKEEAKEALLPESQKEKPSYVREPIEKKKKKEEIKKTVLKEKKQEEDPKEQSEKKLTPEDLQEEKEQPENESSESKEELQEEKKGFFSKIFKRKKQEEDPEIEETLEIDNLSKEEIETKIEEENLKDPIPEEEIQEESQKEGFFKKAVKSVTKKKITEDDFTKIWIELEIFLLEINIAFEIVEKIEKNLKDQLIGNSFTRFKLNEKIREVLIEEVKKVLQKRESNFLEELKKHEKPAKILILGVNGTGKTTSIAKIVAYLQKNSLSVVLAAADTFRAAATEQLEEHAKKLNVKLIQHKGGSDPAAVAFDAIEHAKAKQLDVVLIDTAGRMPNNSNLILELQKIYKVSKSDMVLFVGDSISGNDLIEQIDLFNKAIPINGILLTKVDTDEKPGSIVTTAYSIEQPIYFLGIGQNYEDLVEFDSRVISEKLFSIEDEQ